LALARNTARSTKSTLNGRGKVAFGSFAGGVYTPEVPAALEGSRLPGPLRFRIRASLAEAHPRADGETFP